MRVGIATDHGGYSLKEELMARLRAAGHEIVDFGAHTLNANEFSQADRHLRRLAKVARMEDSRLGSAGR